MKLQNNNAILPTLLLTSSLFLSIFANTAYAQKFTVTVKNLTHGSHFTPLLIAAHDANTHLFQAGELATISLQAMAEGGSISALSSDLTSTGATLSENPAAGLLAPGGEVQTTMLNTNGTNNGYLSVVAMVLPSNDGFVGLSNWKIPNKAGSYTLNINAYDAGTEANNELLGATDAGAVGVLGAPGAPSGSAGTNGTGAATEDTNKKVHIHRGILGDFDSKGGVSDFDSRVHRWLNPVARITVIVE
jgi:hypothetical protein